MRIFREFEELSRQKQIAVGIINTVIGAGIIIAMEGNLGIPASVTIRNILITLVVGAAFLYAYGQIMKWRKVREE